MSFLQNYVTKYRLDDLSSSTIERLKEVEDTIKFEIEKYTGDPEGVFENCLKQHGDNISDLIERIATTVNFSNLKTWKDYLGTSRHIWSIAVEVHQVVEQMGECAIKPDATPQEKKASKALFGTELVYFVWVTVDPLSKKFRWLPFKKTIEKIIVKWIARKALQSVFEMFNANVMSLQTMSSDTFIRGL